MIVVLGGTGLLGRELYKLDNSICCTNRKVDITDYKTLSEFLDSINPDIIINAAAITDSIAVSEDVLPAIEVNIIGASNVAKYCIKHKKRLVYISTDYVYTGNGNHKESDALYPHNDYAWTKLGGECSSRLVEDHCIVRTSFGSSKFPYTGGYTNLYTSKQYVDLVAPKILKVTNSQFKGVINIGGEKKSLYRYAQERNTVNKIQLPISYDFSLNTLTYDKGFGTTNMPNH